MEGGFSVDTWYLSSKDTGMDPHYSAKQRRCRPDPWSAVVQTAEEKRKGQSSTQFSENK